MKTLTFLVVAFGVTTLALLLNLKRKAHCIMLTNDQLATKLDALSDQLGKAKTEITTAIGQLQQVPPNVEAALDRLASATQALDDLNVDTETPAPTEG